MPRPRALDEKKMEAVCAIVAVGGSRQVAAQYVGCHISTLVRTAQRDDGFRERLSQAEAMFEAAHLRNVNAAGKDAKNWRASVWLLERKFPDRYGRRDSASLSMEQVMLLLTQFAEIVVKEVPAEFRKRVLKRLAALKIPTSDGPQAIGHDSQAET